MLLVGLLTVGRIGITWDEPNYFTSSYSYLSWFIHVFENPADWWASIDRYWEQSHEAPPFFKLWAGLFAGAGALLFGTENLGRGHKPKAENTVAEDWKRLGFGRDRDKQGAKWRGVALKPHASYPSGARW